VKEPNSVCYDLELVLKTITSPEKDQEGRSPSVHIGIERRSRRR